MYLSFDNIIFKGMFFYFMKLEYLAHKACDDANNSCNQVKCFNSPLQPSEIVGVKRVVQEKLREGVNERGLTLAGFLFLHALFIEKGRLETTWTVLRKFGYNNDIKLADELIPYSAFKRAPDQVKLQFNCCNCYIQFLVIGSVINV